MPADLDPAAHDPLAGRTFLVTSIGGVAALDAPTAVLGFGPDGRISGRATINRVTGTYRLEGDELICGPLATTMMAGAPEAMVQEQDLLGAFAAPLVVRVTGAEVQLATADGPTVVLREIPGEDVVA